jgi:hypothetical protein
MYNKNTKPKKQPQPSALILVLNMCRYHYPIKNGDNEHLTVTRGFTRKLISRTLLPLGYYPTTSPTRLSIASAILGCERARFLVHLICALFAWALSHFFNVH